MFEPSDTPRVFALPPGVDFARALADGILARHAGHPPEALARLRLIVNTERMARRLQSLFEQDGARLLPRIGLVTDPGFAGRTPPPPPAIPPLRRRLELAQLLSRLVEQQPDIAPRSALFDLADSLAALMDEMQGEGVSPDTVAALEVTDQSGHWARMQAFLGIVRDCFSNDPEAPDAGARQRLIVEGLIAEWRRAPPADPVIVAGSTGSRGATQLLMQAVARLPQGALVLPGFDFDMPAALWDGMDNPLLSEDHPQFRFRQLMQGLSITAADVRLWSDTPAPSPARNRLVSLTLRPAPVTDQWLTDGPALRDIPQATRNITLVEAPSVRTEALAIALRLREAAETGQVAALITPDRGLTRQVAAALDRWRIRPDDSGGLPLHLSPPGRFLRHVAALTAEALTAEALLALLKHPLCHSGAGRGRHLRLTRSLELFLRRKGAPYPAQSQIGGWAETVPAFEQDAARTWAEWLCANLLDRHDTALKPLEARVAGHIALAEALAAGSTAEEGAGSLWQGDAGEKARQVMDDLTREADAGGDLGATDYTSLLHGLLSRAEVRNAVTPHPDIRIWGTLEARVQGADLMILAGLNEGSWPEMPAPDPWLNRTLRHRAGLLLPERRVGLSAHDFQQAIAAPEVWLTRSIRSDDAETVVSRWLNRLQNLLTGLPAQGGKQALSDMRGRGQAWLRLARRIEQPAPCPAAPRPAPCPPVEARPRRLSVTEIRTLIRDPYAIYARHVLGLRPLDPLMRLPDAMLRGTVIHDALEEFVKQTRDDPEACTVDRLLEITGSVLAQNVPWAENRAAWQARLGRVADWFIAQERARRATAYPAHLEIRGRAELHEPAFTLVAKADRIDVDEAGNLHLYDYKTGTPPSEKQQKTFDKQLLLEAAMAERGGFAPLGPARVARAAYIGLGAAKEVLAPLDEVPPAQVWEEFHTLIAAYLSPDQGYAARRAIERRTERGDYDQLARHGEWDVTDPAQRIPLP